VRFFKIRSSFEVYFYGDFMQTVVEKSSDETMSCTCTLTTSCVCVDALTYLFIPEMEQ